MFRFLAQNFTGGDVISIPRPCFLSGVVTTNEGMRPAFSSSFKKTHASSGVPKNANRISLFFCGCVIIDLGCLVGVENALEVIRLVLKNVS